MTGTIQIGLPGSEPLSAACQQPKFSFTRRLAAGAALFVEVVVADDKPLNLGQLPAVELHLRRADEIAQLRGRGEHLGSDVWRA